MFSPQQDEQGGEDENHQRFSILSLLLTLVAAINSGHPTLIGSGVVRQRLHRGKDNKAQLVMDSILAVLVKDTEVMACMTYRRRRGKAGIRTKAVVTIQEQEGLAVATMTNGSLEGDEQPDHYALVPTGTSLLNWKADPEKAVFN